MSILKLMLLSLCLTVPMMAGATTTTSFAGASPATFSLNPGQSAAATVALPTGSFSNVWNLSVGANEKASISFSPLNLQTVLGGISFDILKIDALVSVPGGAYTGQNLLSGLYQFTVSGNATGLSGGIYAAGTTVSAVPVPAAVWFMGSAMIGLFSFRKRKMALAA